MSGFSITVSDEFQTDGLGYALYVKLVEERCRYDIGITTQRLNRERNSVSNLQQSPDVSTFMGIRDAIRDFRLGGSQHKVVVLEKEITAKEAWLKSWLNQAWSKVNDLAGSQIDEIYSASIEDLKTHYSANTQKAPKTYLILQEAALEPLYREGEAQIKEEDIYLGCEYIATLLDFKPGTGKSIITQLENFVREINHFWRKIVQWAVAGALISALIFPFFGLELAALVGESMGLGGAAATSTGLAFFGGGSIVAGGSGMVGGITVLLGGMGLFGSIVGGGSQFLINKSVISKLPTELVVLYSAKTINYVKFITQGYSGVHQDQRVTESHRLAVQSLLTVKYEMEKCLLESTLQTDQDWKKREKDIEILYTAFKNIVKIMSGRD